MPYDRALAEWVCEAMAPLGDVTIKRLFGGASFYLDGTIFAILGFDELWFKSDALIDDRWDAISTDRFEVTSRGGKRMTMNYRRAPSDAYDDADAVQRYAALALEAGRRR